MLVTHDGRIRARIREVGGDGNVELSLWYTVEATEELALETELLPGQYEINVELVEWPDGAAEGDEPIVRGLDRRAITIEAGEVTRADVTD